ncbi:MAG TPA: zinc ribbon domain-containing protein [Pyrinomonadaceae bacterium]
MFCPKCAAQNADDAKYCRGCGADISLVPQAITGQLAQRLNEEEESGRRGHRRKHREPANIENAARQFFLGLAFALVSLAILSWAPGGRVWWFWMLIPAFIMIGGGVGMYLRVREERSRLAPPAYAPAPASLSSPPHATGLPPRRHTGEIVQPPSVTEATTRHLNMPVERTPKDADF